MSSLAVVAFDVIETLATLEPLRDRLVKAGQPPGLLETWYTRILRDGMALSMTGDYSPFADVAEAALRGLTHDTISDDQVAQLMAGFSELPAYPDALPAVRRLSEAGLPVACLTNGPADLISAFVERAGLGPWVNRVISVGEVFRWKRPAWSTCTRRRSWGLRPTGWHWSRRTTGTATAPSGPG